MYSLFLKFVPTESIYGLTSLNKIEAKSLKRA